MTDVPDDDAEAFDRHDALARRRSLRGRDDELRRPRDRVEGDEWRTNYEVTVRAPSLRPRRA